MARSHKDIQWDVLDALQGHMSDNPLSVQQICDIIAHKLKDEGSEQNPPTTKTIRATLENLNNHPEHLSTPVHCKRAAKTANSNTKTSGSHMVWYLSEGKTVADAGVSPTEIQLLATAVRSMPIQPEMSNDLLDIIGSLTRQQLTHREVNNLQIENPYINKDFFSVVSTISQAIEENQVVTFEYLDYHGKHSLKPRLNQDGSLRVYKLLPYQMIYKTGIYYLFGERIDSATANNSHRHHSQDSADASGPRSFQLHRVANAKILDTGGPLSESALQRKRAFDIERELHNSPYVYLAKSQEIVLDMNQTALNNFFAWFSNADKVELRNGAQGDHCGETAQDGTWYRVTFHAPPMPVSWWVLQFSGENNIRVVRNDQLIQLLVDATKHLYGEVAALQVQARKTQDRLESNE